jgi:hypothetical protein
MATHQALRPDLVAVEDGLADVAMCAHRGSMVARSQMGS